VDKPENRQNRLNMAEKVEKEGVSYLLEVLIPGLLGKSTLAVKPEVKRQLTQWIQQTLPNAVALAQRAMANRRDQTDLLKKIKAKTLILAGQEDILIPTSESEAMCRAIPGSRLQVLDKVGHLLPLEDPQKFQNLLEEFLATKSI
jgi:3-oxoadipate enol-lactonase